MTKKTILVTGGTGYLGSHTCVALAEAGYQPLLLDNFSNSHFSVLNRLEGLLGERPSCIEGDIRDEKLLKQIFEKYPCEGVIHFAGLKAVGESIDKPLSYYDSNVSGTLCLLKAMQEANVTKLIFSSSAAVYGGTSALPIKENSLRQTLNPYGRSKLMVEEILEDLYQAEPFWSIIRLRYFNPIGAHPSGLIGENPHGVPNNLMPYITRVASGMYQKLLIFGGDYETEDGTPLRDYIHVMDLAEGHVAALKQVQAMPQLQTFNLGTGQGTSVLTLVRSFEEATGEQIPYEIVARRPGDAAACWANASAAEQELHWKAKYDLKAMCADSWRWQQFLKTA